MQTHGCRTRSPLAQGLTKILCNCSRVKHREVVFLLGEAAATSEARALVLQYRAADLDAVFADVTASGTACLARCRCAHQSRHGHHAQPLAVVSDAGRVGPGRVPRFIRPAALMDFAINCRMAWRWRWRSRPSLANICCVLPGDNFPKAMYSTGGCRQPGRAYAHIFPMIASGWRMRRMHYLNVRRRVSRPG